MGLEGHQIRAVFFDIGDTLVFDDPPLFRRLLLAIETLGITVPLSTFREGYLLAETHALSRYLTGVSWQSPGVLRECAEMILDHAGVAKLSDTDWNTLLRAYGNVLFKRYLHPGVLPLLQDLRLRGFIIGAISDWEPCLPEILAELKIDIYFDAIAVSSVVGAVKPAPALFERALRQADVTPDRALHIGDWFELDVAGARNAGMHALLFDHAGRNPSADCPRVETFELVTSYLAALSL